MSKTQHYRCDARYCRNDAEVKDDSFPEGWISIERMTETEVEGSDVIGCVASEDLHACCADCAGQIVKDSDSISATEMEEVERSVISVQFSVVKKIVKRTKEETKEPTDGAL